MDGRHRVWRRIDPDLFRFTTTDSRDLHVALMVAFEGSAVLAPALRFDQVRAALADTGWDEPTDDELVQRSLEKLVEWGLLEATQDHGAHYATPEEFERRNIQWSLTPRGEAAVAGLLQALEALGQAVALQPAVLDVIGDGLGELAELLDGAASPEVDARIHLRLAEVENHLASLIGSVRQFNGHLQRLVREDVTDDDLFLDVKRRTVAYLEEYVQGVERPQRRVAAAVERLEGRGPAALFDRALAGANLAPVAGSDPAPAWMAERWRRWYAIRAWFAPSDDAPPRITGLLEIARTAIVELLRALERRWDGRRRSASVAHDFTRLAELFDAAPGDDDAHRLFAAAFGLWPARHAHLRSLDGDARAPTTSWLDAEPVRVAPALRTTGSLQNRGRPHPIPDPTALRLRYGREQAEALAAHDALRASLATGEPVRLSSFDRLLPGAFGELLALLAAGLDAPMGSDGVRRALSADGRVEVLLQDPGDGRLAALHTSDGVLRGPDLLVSIVPATAPDREQTVSAEREASGA